jgi:hypothetical protein
MRRLAAATLALLLLAQAPPAARVEDLAWMSGRWLASEDGHWTEEIWSGPRGGTLMGFSWSGEGATIREYEFLRIQSGEDDEIVYLAQPNGGAGIGFYLVRAEGTSATFENPAHDFPQRIRYVRSEDTLTATISAIDGSRARSWTYRKQ